MKYEVIIPWYGVKKGEVVERESLHPALEANVRLLGTELVPAVEEKPTKKTK